MGAFLCLNQSQMDQYKDSSAEFLMTQLAPLIIYKKYHSKKSTWSEIKTVIDALTSIQSDAPNTQTVELYTDCQSLCDLIGKRQQKLERSHFKTRAGKIFANADLYKELFAIVKSFQIRPIKIKGHNSLSCQVTIREKIFAILDKLNRKQLRICLEQFTAE